MSVVYKCPYCGFKSSDPCVVNDHVYSEHAEYVRGRVYRGPIKEYPRSLLEAFRRVAEGEIKFEKIRIEGVSVLLKSSLYDIDKKLESNSVVIELHKKANNQGYEAKVGDRVIIERDLKSLVSKVSTLLKEVANFSISLNEQYKNYIESLCKLGVLEYSFEIPSIELKLRSLDKNSIVREIEKRLIELLSSLEYRLSFTDERYAELFEKLLVESEVEIPVEELDKVQKLVEAKLVRVYIKPSEIEAIKYILKLTGRLKEERSERREVREVRGAILRSVGAWRCEECGGELAFYNEVSTFKGETIVLYRCKKCGKVVRLQR